MKTSKPVSTISFNSEAYLRGKLRELTAAGVLEFWAYIRHDPEPDEVGDEAGGKQHFHVYMEPAKMIQTTDLRAAFRELDPTNPKPLGCLLVEKSKFDDWYLYALHDADYLASKGQSRALAYEPEQVRTSDEDDLHSKVARIDVGAITPYITMARYQRAGKDFRDYVLREQINIRDISAFQRAWAMLLSTTVDRGGRPGHASEYEEPAAEPETTDGRQMTIEDFPEYLPGEGGNHGTSAD